MSDKITLRQAVVLASRYRQEKDDILKSEYSGTNILPLSEIFDKSDFETLLALPECTSIRAYYGMQENKNVVLIFVAADENGNDILPEDDDDLNAPGGSIFEFGGRCPPLCGGGLNDLSPDIND